MSARQPAGEPPTPGLTTGLAGRAAVEDPSGEARRALFVHVLGRIHRYFARLVRDPAEAEDLVQATLIRLEQGFASERYDAARSFNAWLWMKAHAVYVDACRASARRVATAPLEGADEPAARGAGLHPGERLDLATALAALGEAQGAEVVECFVLRYESGLSLEELACACGTTRKTVRARLDGAHAFLARWREQRERPVVGGARHGGR